MSTYIIILLVLVSIAILYLAYYFLISLYKDYKYIYKQKKLTVNDLRKGDILFRKATFMGLIVPGYYTHSAIYIGKEKNIPYIVESFLFKGYRKIKLSKFLLVGKISVSRVKNINDKQIDKVLKWVILNKILNLIILH